MKVFDKAIESRLDRQRTFIALGGGVICGMCGYAAASFLRGFIVIQIPTTVMAQVCRGSKTSRLVSPELSAFGCKCHLNVECFSSSRWILWLGENRYKSPSWENLIGAFYQPQ